MKYTKTLLLLAIGLLFGFHELHAQKVAVVDINLVLESLEEYKTAQADVDKIAARWRQEIEQEFGDLTIMPVLGRQMDALVAENCRGIMYFIGGDRAIAQDMFVDSAGGKKPIYRSKKFLAAAGLTVGTGAAIAIAAQKRRPNKKS